LADHFGSTCSAANLLGFSTPGAVVGEQVKVP